MGFARIAHVGRLGAAATVVAACVDLGGLHDADDAGTPAGPDASEDVVAPPPIDAPAETTPDAGTYGDFVRADNPAAYWTLDDQVGSSTARDVAGRHDANVLGAVSFGVKGIAGTAMHIDVMNGGYLDVGNVFDFVGTTAYTIELWATPEGLDTRTYSNIAEKRAFTATTQVGWVLYFRGMQNPTDVQFEQPWQPDGGRVAWAQVDLTKAPVHVVVTYDPTQDLRLFVDNVRTTNAFSDDGGPAANPASLVLGRGFAGLVDEIAIYDHALSAERIEAHFRAGRR